MKKFCPYPLWDIRGMELWLCQMADNGFLLEKSPGFMSVGRFTFQPSEKAKGVRFRLDPVGRGWELSDRAANYRELGWQFVGRISNLYAIYRCDAPSVPDLYTDLESLGWAMKKLLRQQWLALPLCLIWALWLMHSDLALLFTAPAVLLMRLILHSDLIPLYLILWILILGDVWKICRYTVQFTRLRRRLAKGQEPPIQRPTYPQLRENLYALTFAVLLLLVMLFLFRKDGSFSNRLLSGQEEWDFPHVTLLEVMPEGTQLREYDPLEKLFHDTFTSSYLAPEQYDTRQSAMARLPDGTSRNVVLSLQYIKARSPELADWVYTGKVQEWHQKLEEYQENWEENTSTLHQDTPACDFFTEGPLSYPGLDQLTRFTYQFSDEDYPRACYVGQLGEQVFLMWVRGPEVEKPLELLTERINQEM